MNTVNLINEIESDLKGAIIVPAIAWPETLQALRNVPGVEAMIGYYYSWGGEKRPLQYRLVVNGCMISISDCTEYAKRNANQFTIMYVPLEVNGKASYRRDNGSIGTAHVSRDSNSKRLASAVLKFVAGGKKGFEDYYARIENEREYFSTSESTISGLLSLGILSRDSDKSSFKARFNSAVDVYGSVEVYRESVSIEARNLPASAAAEVLALIAKLTAKLEG